MKISELIKKLGYIITAPFTLNGLPDAVLFVSNTGIINFYNKRAQDIFGFTNTNADYKLSEVLNNSQEIVKKSDSLNQPVLATAVRNGNEFYVEINAQQNVFGYLVIVRDITSLTAEIKNDEKIVKFNNEKNAMLVKLEDDIKSPLSSIVGFSQGLLDGLGGELSEKQNKYVKIINNNAVQLSAFIDKFLTFSKVESSIYEENYHTFDVVELIKNKSKEFIDEIDAKGLTFDIDGNGVNNRNIYTDSNALQTAFQNILEVAVDMTEKGYISVKVANPGEDICALHNITDSDKYLYLSVRDSGVGIANEEMKFLCEPYAQLEKGKKNLMRAFKLGIASILVKRLNGIITIKSEVMKGSRFEVIVPIEKRKNE